jgi:hypothetical protein
MERWLRFLRIPDATPRNLEHSKLRGSAIVCFAEHVFAGIYFHSAESLSFLAFRYGSALNLRFRRTPGPHRYILATQSVESRGRAL